ncbi:MAG: undecaprenyldiphospho-muramoylpentapeptide beta-N-acetylglucosaminyltransferase [Pseudomonadota bacterium]
MKKRNVVITGGGTGGHIYPGLALAETLKKDHPDIQVHFVGAQGGLEEKIVPKHGYPLHLLRVGRLHHSVSRIRRFKALFLLPISFFQSLLLFIRLRPQWVLGIGGFASGPFVFVSSVFGGRTAVLEPNAFPGLANRWLSKVVRYCFVVFKEAGQYFPSRKVKNVGLPVRMNKIPASPSFQKDRPLRILIFGGSQGARAVNNVVGEWIESLENPVENFEIVHQVGAHDHKIWLERYGDRHVGFLRYSDYLDDMPERLQWADLVICRAGVGSVIEVAMTSKPTLFIPLPTAADNHQVKNAEVLVKKGGALMIEEKNLSPQKLGDAIEDLRQNPQKLHAMALNLNDFDSSQAPKDILGVLMNGEK